MNMWVCIESTCTVSKPIIWRHVSVSYAIYILAMCVCLCVLVWACMSSVPASSPSRPWMAWRECASG